MTTVYEHLEKFAGEISGGWSSDPDGNKSPFQIVQTAGGPHLGTTTFSTLGLSKFALPDGQTGHEARLIRHELIMVVPKDAVPGNIAGILLQAGMDAISRNAAYLRGEMLGPKGALFEGYEPRALYACIPVYFPEEFAVVNSEESGDVVFVWLVPILDNEIHYLHTHGWPAFEKRLIAEDPDLVDYRRTP